MDIREYVSLTGYTSYRIGGPARYFIAPQNSGEVQQSVAFAQEQCLPYYVLGNGTNVLVSDWGVNGVVIYMGQHFHHLEVNGTQVEVGPSVLLGKLVRHLAHQSLGGFEILAGIPGSVAGAVVMNAGAHRVFIGDFVKGVTVVTAQGRAEKLSPQDLEFGYRTSVLQNSSHIIVGITLKVEPGDPEQLEATIASAMEKRKNHPQLPSCGSTFRNPPGIPAGQLIEELGLKGTRIGNAQISPQHGNFIVNLGSAKAQDVYSLITLVQHEAQAKRGIDLRPEVKMWGEFENPPA